LGASAGEDACRPTSPGRCPRRWHLLSACLLSCRVLHRAKVVAILRWLTECRQPGHQTTRTDSNLRRGVRCTIRPRRSLGTAVVSPQEPGR
jgi:hypothetical protein